MNMKFNVKEDDAQVFTGNRYRSFKKCELGSKVGIFPGTFDPIQFGHLDFVENVIKNFDLDNVLFYPHIHSSHVEDDNFALRQKFLEDCLYDMLKVNKEIYSKVGVLELSIPLQRSFRGKQEWTSNLFAYLRKNRPETLFYRLFGEDRVETVDLELADGNFCGTRGKNLNFISPNLEIVPSIAYSATEVRDGKLQPCPSSQNLVSRRRGIIPGLSDRYRF